MRYAVVVCLQAATRSRHVSTTRRLHRYSQVLQPTFQRCFLLPLFLPFFVFFFSYLLLLSLVYDCHTPFSHPKYLSSITHSSFPQLTTSDITARLVLYTSPLSKKLKTLILRTREAQTFSISFYILCNLIRFDASSIALQMP